ncbi:MAG: alanine racemase [Congregibacter sp.]
MHRQTIARVFPERLRHNVRRVAHHAPGAKIMACVKADGYGHGMLNVATAINDEVNGFAVACLEEALTLREAGVEKDVLLLEGPHHPEEIEYSAQHGVTLKIASLDQLQWLCDTPENRRPPCWLKIDTGMHRLGIAPAEAANAYARLRQLLPADADIVVSTHFAQADAESSEATERQLNVFNGCIVTLEEFAQNGQQNKSGKHIGQSCANSAGILRYPQSHRSWVRPGYMLYGGSPFAFATAESLGLQPAMSFDTQVIALRDLSEGESVGYGGRWRATRPSRIATLAAGYGDGYPRSATDGTGVTIGRYLCPLAGRVSMDMLTVDVTDHPDVHIGSTATLWGNSPHVDEVAARAQTIGYELLAGMPKRVPRQVDE